MIVQATILTRQGLGLSRKGLDRASHLVDDHDEIAIEIEKSMLQCEIKLVAIRSQMSVRNCTEKKRSAL